MKLRGRSIGFALIWTVLAGAALLLSNSHALAQSQDPGDQPGVEADDSYELPPEYQKQMVFYRTSEPPGTIIVETSERHLYLIQPGGRA
jgi:lipoprotein-anchoring transpeptidase ErfK/SrfK